MLLLPYCYYLNLLFVENAFLNDSINKTEI